MDNLGWRRSADAEACNASTVLLIESDEVFRDAMRAGFARVGCTVHLASDDASGLKQFLALVPRVVVTNITSTPGSIGNILTMRRASQSVRIVAMSGNDQMDSARCLSMATHLGADHVIAKPFDVTDLVARVSVMLTHRCDSAS